jgi:hypothetical protein
MPDVRFIGFVGIAMHYRESIALPLIPSWQAQDMPACTPGVPKCAWHLLHCCSAHTPFNNDVSGVQHNSNKGQHSHITSMPAIEAGLSYTHGVGHCRSIYSRLHPSNATIITQQGFKSNCTSTPLGSASYLSICLYGSNQLCAVRPAGSKVNLHACIVGT